MATKIAPVQTVVWIGLVAGTLDITDNLIFNQLRGITPRIVFQYIASVDRDERFSKRFRVGRSRRSYTLHDRAHLDGRVLCGKPPARASHPPAYSLRFALWRGRISVHELRCLAALERPAPAGCDDACFTNQRRAGSFALHRIADVSRPAQEFGSKIKLLTSL
jgi:hypothetical protein